MRMYTHILVRRIVAGLTLTALFLVACTNGGTATREPSQPPQIPPQSSFVMDFADFAPAPQTSLAPGRVMQVSFKRSGGLLSTPEAIGDRSNWGYAALNVGFWNIVGALGMAVPVASFVESFKHSPTQQPDLSWVWTYTVTVQRSTYSAELHGRYIDRGVRWEMHVSKQGEYSDFVWYYGESDLLATEGFWVLKNKPSDPTDLIRINWRRDTAKNTGDIKYANVVPGGAENGGYISYSVTRSTPYDRAYNIYNKGKNQTTYIEWNSATKEGRVKDSAHFRDDNWHYWNSELINVESR